MMPRRANRTSFKPGQTGNPAGRPRAKEQMAGGLVKAAWDRIMATDEGQKLLTEAIRAGLQDRRQRLGFIELGARLNKEIGPGADMAVPVVNVIINGTPLDPSKLR